MIAILALILFFAPLLSLLIYRYNGKKQIFYLDLVQFLYLAVFAPVMFVWVKSLLYLILRSEMPGRLTMNQLFVIDTAFSVVAFFIFSSVAIHSMTKTFWFKRREDPHFDLYHISEYFHLWWSHIVGFVGGMLILTILAMSNLLIPFIGDFWRWQFWAIVTSGVFFGLLGFYAIWNSDPLQGNFMRIMKLAAGIFFLCHVVLYFIFNPNFSAIYGVYWFSAAAFFTFAACSASLERSPRARRIRDWFTHVGWGENISLFNKKGK